jgi:hypothetical protein
MNTKSAAIVQAAPQQIVTARQPHAEKSVNTEIQSMLEATRLLALNGGLPIRRKDGTLYALLAKCLAICEKVQRERREDDLREAVRVRVNIRGQNNKGKGRRYAENGSDAFVLVCRYVLSGDARNSYRYAVTLREASKRQISSDDLQEWLTENGGVQAIFLTRPLEAKSARCKIFHLTESIEYPKAGEFTITLAYDGRGRFIPKGVAARVHQDGV